MTTTRRVLQLACLLVQLLVGGRADVSDALLDPPVQTHMVAEGERVVLPCHVKGDISSPVFWSDNRNRFYFVGNYKQTDDDRFSLLNGDDKTWNLVIDPVEIYDSATYECKLAIDNEHKPSISHHRVVVLVPPAVSIEPDTNPLVIKRGDSLHLTCKTRGEPMPNVTWTRLGAPLPAGNESHDNDQLYYVNASAAHSGVYECTGKSSVGEARAQITVDIQYENGKDPFRPWVRVEQAFVPVREGADVNISCQLDGQPPPSVQWFLQSAAVDLRADGQYAQFESRRNNFTEATLAIRAFEQTRNGGDYRCRVANNHGGPVEGSVTVSALPGPPQVQINKGKSTWIRVAWSLQSAETVSRYKILYRAEKDDTPAETLVPATAADNAKDNRWASTGTVRGLLPETDYVVQVLAENRVGWGFYPKQETKHRTGKTEPRKWVAPRRQRQGGVSGRDSIVVTDHKGAAGRLSLCKLLISLAPVLLRYL